MGACIDKTVTPQLDPDGIALGQTLSSGGVQDFTLNGVLSISGVFTATDSAHIIELASTGDDSLLTFTVYGTDSRGVVISEAVSGTNASTASTLNHFKTVTQVSSSGDTAANVEIGVSGLAVSPWILFNDGVIVNIGLFVRLSTGASLIYQVEHTEQDIQDPTLNDFQVYAHADLNNKTVSDDGNYSAPAKAYRLNITSFTSGTADFVSLQAY